MPSGQDYAVLIPVDASLEEHREAISARFGGAAALTHCVRRHADAAQIVVVVAESLSATVDSVLATDGAAATVVVVGGSGSRTECLRAGLAALDATYVLVHDVRHPLAPAELGDRLLADLRRGHDVVVPSLAMVDSVKSVDRAGTVTATVDRALLHTAQFPRGFRASLLAAAVARSDRYDELQAPLTLVAGDPDAFRFDMPNDARLADAIVECRRAERQ